MSTESTQRIEEAAGDWLARRDHEDWSQEDQRKFDAWLAESTLHRVAYLRIENAWEEALRLKALGAGIQSDRPPPPGQWNLSPFFSSRADDPPLSTPWRGAALGVRALAASVVFATAVALGFWLWPKSDSFVTPVGALASLPMEDGSKVTLNTDSAIKIAITEKERRVELQQGEAFFDVAKDPKRPFVVTVGDKRIIVIGTKFSVRRAPGEAADIQVVVTEGAVRVESKDGKGVERIAAKPLTAGTVAHANRDGLMVQEKALPEVEEQLAWRSGVLVFRDVTLADAAAEFNRYNERKIVIEDAGSAGLRIAGNFRTTNVEAFVRLLEQGYPVSAESGDKKIVVRAR